MQIGDKIKFKEDYKVGARVLATKDATGIIQSVSSVELVIQLDPQENNVVIACPESIVEVI